jgi:DNA-binding HxlR family transcriptional regulator
MRRRSSDDLECSLAKTLDVVGEGWTLLVVRDLFFGVQRFDELQRDLGVARNVLTDRLRKLEHKGIAERRMYQTNPRRYEYRLTDKGMDLFPVVLALLAWGDRWESKDGPPVLLRHGHDDHVVRPAMLCAKCHHPIHPHEVRLSVGPGAKRPELLPLPLRPVPDGKGD